MNKDDVNSQANVVKSVENENDEVTKTKQVIDYAASKHIRRD